MSKQLLRAAVRGAYDIQKLRIMNGNRLCASFYVKLGVEPGTSPDEMKIEDGKILEKLLTEHKRMADMIAAKQNGKRQLALPPSTLISTQTEYALIEQYLALVAVEKDHFKMIGKQIKAFPIWTEFLKNVKGVGPAMAGVIISEVDIAVATYPSSLWKYAGLDVAKDGKGRSRRIEHLIDVEYIDKNGEKKTRKSIQNNPFLKTKLIGVLATSFLRTSSPYRDTYDAYKYRLENHPKHVEKKPGHRHNMAMRYMVKRFLVDLYVAWRKLEGLPVSPEYSEAKLGMKHRQTAET